MKKTRPIRMNIRVSEEFHAIVTKLKNAPQYRGLASESDIIHMAVQHMARPLLPAPEDQAAINDIL